MGLENEKGSTWPRYQDISIVDPKITNIKQKKKEKKTGKEKENKIRKKSNPLP